MYDLVIRGGTVIDGTQAPRQTADVAITGGQIVEVGQMLGAAKREIDADGLLVTPGWVDIHTHYDGQATWDPDMTPSSWHGVTTAVFGNCGVGFAPVKPGAEKFLINLMEGVEDIPETVLSEGVDFRWESFADYMDVLDETPRVMDIGAQVPHGALRFYVMGDRGADHREQPTAAEIDEMGNLLEEALKAGALGFTTSRTTKHRAADGRPTPSLSAEEPELAGLALAMKRAGKGVIEVNSDFGDGDFARLRAAAELAERPLSVLLVQVNDAPDLWTETLAGVDDAVAHGLDFTAQVGSRAIGMLFGLDASIHPFVGHECWDSLESLPLSEKVARIQNDTTLRAALLDGLGETTHGRWMSQALEKTFAFSDPVDLEPNVASSVATQARAANRPVLDFALDLLLQDGGKTLLMHTFENYCSGDLGAVETMLRSPNSVCGVADAGAHVGLICDASSPTTLLTHWARDRSRGEQMPLEYLVHKQTRATARVYGLHDRGAIRPGMRADINIIDFDALGIERPRVVHDLPAGGRRIVQRSFGYRHTFVAGTEVSTDGELTGARPGRLIRS
ncbi:MAG: N-acyl-D-amino-acid deacylase family protein [Gammaproteobacteria bacterium]